MQGKILEEIRSVVGEEHLIENQARMEAFLSGPETPLAVIFPGETGEVARVIALCNEHGVKLCVAGHTVSSQGLRGGIAMVLSRMNRVLEIDHENLVAEVEAGASHTVFQQRIAEQGLYFPPEPYSGAGSSIGACIAEGEPDCKAFLYGPPRTYVLGFEMVLPTGEVLSCGNKVIKNVSGYDLIHFIVGSRGTLGVITKVLLKLLPLPEARRTVAGSFPSLARAMQVMLIMMERRIYPARLTLLNAPLAGQLAPRSGPFAPGHLVLVDLEGFRDSTEHLADEIMALFRLEGAGAALCIEEAGAIDDLWRQWLQLKESCLGTARDRAIDFLVGPAHLAKALNGLERLVPDLGSDSGLIVHALNGNLRLFPAPEHDLTALLKEVNRLALKHGGNLAGDLGFRMKCEELRENEMWQEMVALTAGIRSRFDPKGILAPGIHQ
jgi:glycolate oxidase